MKINPANNYIDAPGIVSFTGQRGANLFKKVVDEIYEEGIVEPFFFQYGNLPRVAGSDYPAYVFESYLDYDGEIILPFCKKETLPDDELLDIMSEYESEYEEDPSLDAVVIIDGAGYEDDTILSLPEYERAFVVFPPYLAYRTAHITEAKRYLQRATKPKEERKGFAAVVYRP